MKILNLFQINRNKIAPRSPQVEKRDKDPVDSLCLSSNPTVSESSKTKTARTYSHSSMLKDLANATFKTALYSSLFMVDKIFRNCIYHAANLFGKDTKSPVLVKSDRSTSRQKKVLWNELMTFPNSFKDSVKSIKELGTNPPKTIESRLEIDSVSHSAENTLSKIKLGMPYQKIDSKFMKQIDNSGWQGKTIFAGGEDIEDQSVIAWTEHGRNGKSMHFTCKLTPSGNKKLAQKLKQQRTFSMVTGTLDRQFKRIKRGSLELLNEAAPIHMGKTIDINLEGMTIHYHPYETNYNDTPNAEVTPYASQGELNITIQNPEMKPEEVKKVLDNIAELGVDSHPSTPEDLEYLYLKKMIWAMGFENKELDKSLKNAKNVTEKASICKTLLSQKLELEDVTKVKGYDWKPKFSSLYKPRLIVAENEKAGQAYWERFDADTYIDNELKDYHITHNIYSERPADVICKILESTGKLVSTESRFNRLGMVVGGISSNKDRQRGGASYVFTHLTRNSKDIGFVFSKDLLKRSDHVAFPMGVFGKVRHGRAKRRKVQLSKYHCTPLYEIMFKDSVSLIDYLEQVNVGSNMERNKVLKALERAGISELRGKPIEEIVRVVKQKN